MRRRDFLSLLTICTPAFSADAKELINKTIYALGGDAFRNMEYRTETGRAYSFYHEKLSGLSIARIYTRYLPASSTAAVKEVQRQVFGKKLDEAVIFGEKDAWDVTYRGATPIAPDRVEQFRMSVINDIFYILRQRLNEPGLGMDLTGSEVVENQSTQVVDIFDTENRSVRVWISTSTSLPVRQRFMRWDPVIKDRREEVTHYSNYRDSGNGVMLPWATERERDKERIYQMYAEQVTVTKPVDNTQFELAPGVKILKKP
jgi:hypothetical protein